LSNHAISLFGTVPAARDGQTDRQTDGVSRFLTVPSAQIRLFGGQTDGHTTTAYRPTTLV